MEENILFHNRYTLVRLLGRGAFSEVWLGRDTLTKTEVALKIYAPATGLDDSGLDIFAREFAIVVNANHRNLLKPLHYDVCERKPYLVLPYCKNGSTKKRVGIFKEEEIWKLLYDVASGLAFLHEMKPPVIHQDIKPDNIMVSNHGDYMLTDFGVSSHCRSALRRSVSEAFASAGTTAYMAPERFGKKGNVAIMANDIYSLGATAFELLTGDTPFGDDGGLRQMKGAQIPSLPEKCSSNLRKVVNLCLRSEPWERPTAAQLAKYAEHGMKGEFFLVKEEKSLLKKILPYVVASVCLIAGFILWGISKQKAEEAEAKEIQYAIEQENAFNDSVMAIFTACLDGALSQHEIGNLRDEGYEKALIMAYQEYHSALEVIDCFKNKDMSVESQQIQDSIMQIEMSLNQTYSELKEKAAFFDDDETIKAEFEERAATIANILKIKEDE